MALETQKEVEQLADSLTKSADVMHKQLLKQIRKGLDHAQAQLIFQDEAVLRQKANALYIDAAQCVTGNLAASQDEVIGLIATANDKLKKFEDLKQFVDLIADLLVLASAAYAAKPGPLLAALKEVRKDLNA